MNRIGLSVFFALGLVLFPGRAPGLTAVLEGLEHPAFSIERAELELGAQALLRLYKLRLMERHIPQLTVRCGRFSQSGQDFECADGQAEAVGIEGKLPFHLSLKSGQAEMDIRFGKTERWHIVRRADGALSADVVEGRADRLSFLLGADSAWKFAGSLNGRIELNEDRLNARLRVTDGVFSDSGGLHAGEKLAGEIALTARRSQNTWTWQADVRWQGGEFLWQPVYAAAAGQSLKAHGKLDAEHLEIASLALKLPNIGEITGHGQMRRSDGQLEKFQLSGAGLDMTRGAESFMTAFFAAQGIPDASLRGKLSFFARWDKAGLEALTLALNDMAMRAKDGRFILAGVNGGLPWLRDAPSQGYLEVSAARLGEFKLGAFRLPLKVAPGQFSIERSEIPLLDSQLVIEHLIWRRPDPSRGWEGDLSLTLNPVSLPELTRAAGLPEMAGSLSASFPHLRYRDGAAFLDGALVIQVFEGYLNCTELRIDDPAGPAPRLTAHIDARHINLGQLTETFSFGRITGFADAQITGLELLGWRPQRFDARLISSPGNYPRRISQRAVQNISALGGAGAGAAIQRSLLSVFEEFGYRRIGFSCQLRGGVCTMGGIDDKPQGYVMVEGGGLPALTVMGYNRRVDWPVLLERLMGAIEGQKTAK